MKKTIKRIVVILVVLLVLCCAVLTLDTELRVKLFVAANGSDIVSSYQNHGSVPASIGYKYYNLWEGSHDMLEFILFSRGDTYYGCYFSFDDVPLAFQNIDIELTSEREGWHWTAEGDNHGYTKRLAPGWYYFKASF